MTTNIDRAADIIHDHHDNCLDAANALADAGLLAPELPEANDPDDSFVPNGKGWILDGPEGPVVRTIRGTIVWVQGINHGGLNPEQTRALALALLAAADYVEGGDRADA